MAFCMNCGKSLPDGAKFCSGCGTTVGEISSEQKTQRNIVFDGDIHKCPNCGEVINSFVAICPACGFELKEKQASSSLQQFIEKVKECDRAIANSRPQKTGWASWSQAKRIGWVVLNICFLCIPLLIYLVWSLVTIKTTPNLSSEEKQMVSLIENFPFPNDRASILAALIYIKEKVDFISAEKVDKKAFYWIRLWCAKAEQLKQKAEMLFPNDTIVNQSYAKIQDDKNRVRKTINHKTLIFLIVLAFAIILFVGIGETDDNNSDVTFEWQTNGLFAELPQPQTNNGKIVIEAEQQVSFELYNVESEDFENYVKECRDAGFNVDIFKTDTSFYATDEDGNSLDISYNDYNKEINVIISSY